MIKALNNSYLKNSNVLKYKNTKHTKIETPLLDIDSSINS